MRWCEIRKSDGVVVRSGKCPAGAEPPAPGKDCVVLLDFHAIAGKHRIEHEGFDIHDQPKNPRLVAYTKPPKPIPEEQRPVHLTQGEYQQLLARIEASEQKIEALEKKGQ